MKKIIVVVLSLFMIVGMAGCGKKETPTEEQTATKPSEVVSMETEKTEEKSESEIKAGEWEIVNVPFEQAPQEVKNVFNKAMESVTETLNPTTYLASQVVSGMNYAFLATDNVNANRYVFVYKNAKGEIERIEISKPNEKLEILPNEQIDEALGITETETAEGTTNEAENNNEETQTQPEVINHNDNSSTSNNSETNNSNSNSSNTSNSNSNNNSNSNSSSSEQKPTYKNAEEALIGIYGSKEGACKALNPDGTMDIQLKENDIIYSYTYPEEMDKDVIQIRKNEIIEAMKGPVTENHVSFIKDLESKSNISGVKIIVNYLEKTGKEIVTVQFDKNGMK